MTDRGSAGEVPGVAERPRGSPGTPGAGVSTREEVATALRHPAVASGLAVWAAATAWLWLADAGGALALRALQLAAVALFGLLTVALTRPRESEPPSGRIGWQLAALGAVVLVTGYGGLRFHEVVATPPVPLWSNLSDLFAHAGRTALPEWLVGHPANAGRNFGQYVVVPLVVLLALGGRPGGLGLDRGHRSMRVALLWCAIPIGVLGWQLATGGLAPAALVRRLGSHFFQNGFSEEFLFRGAVQTRLEPVLGRGWALLVQALAFGVWHVGAMTDGAGAVAVASGLAGTLLLQAVLGLGLGIVFLRTRSLVAPTLVHVFSNAIG